MVDIEFDLAEDEVDVRHVGDLGQKTLAISAAPNPGLLGLS